MNIDSAYFFEWAEEMGLDPYDENSFDAYREYVLERREGVE